MTGQRAFRRATRAATATVGSVRSAIGAFGASSRRVRVTLSRGTPAQRAQAPFDGRRFRNVEPGSRVPAGTFPSLLWDVATRGRTDRRPLLVPIERPDFPDDAADLAATWLGHASVLFEIDGHRILADPMLSDRASPAGFTGPRRLHPAPVTAAELPPLDAILISHDHYDHLDTATVAALLTASDAPFLVPLGIGAHLRRWGAPAGRIVELDWHGSHRVGTVQLTCTPARHFSGRGLTRNSTLWSSWAIAGPAHRAFFGGDTGYTRAFCDIGHTYGPFDLTALPIGAYDAAWPDVHMTPEQALQAHHDLRGVALLPIHWATFDLARHRWAEPIERLRRAALEDTIITPSPGCRTVIAGPSQGVDPGASAGVDPCASAGAHAEPDADNASGNWWRAS